MGSAWPTLVVLPFENFPCKVLKCFSRGDHYPLPTRPFPTSLAFYPFQTPSPPKRRVSVPNRTAQGFFFPPQVPPFLITLLFFFIDMTVVDTEKFSFDSKPFSLMVLDAFTKVRTEGLPYAFAHSPRSSVASKLFPT